MEKNISWNRPMVKQSFVDPGKYQQMLPASGGGQITDYSQDIATLTNNIAQKTTELTNYQKSLASWQARYNDFLNAYNRCREGYRGNDCRVSNKKVMDESKLQIDKLKSYIASVNTEISTMQANLSNLTKLQESQDKIANTYASKGITPEVVKAETVKPLPVPENKMLTENAQTDTRSKNIAKIIIFTVVILAIGGAAYYFIIRKKD